MPKRRAVAVRRARPFDPDFAERDPRFWPLARSIAALAPLTAFPPPSRLDAIFAARGLTSHRFVPSEPRKRRHAALDPARLYDARITLERAIPTREGCWHDFMNALVWGAFPRAKQAIHARQHHAIVERLAPGATSLPPARTRELDALALLDEGGVLLLAADPGKVHATVDASRAESGRQTHAKLAALADAGELTALLFGHALYESLALGFVPAVVAGLVLPRPPPLAPIDLDVVDARLAEVVADRTKLRAPDALVRVGVAIAVPPRSDPSAG